MIKSVKAYSVQGTIDVPSSKSYFQRVLCAASLSKDSTIIHFNHISDDVAYLIEVFRQMGHEINEENNNLVFVPKTINQLSYHLNFGESGLASRMMVPVLSSIGGRFEVNGEGSIEQRPFDPIIAVLEKHGVEIKSHKGKLPISIDGQLKAGEFEIDGALSSQFSTGLLMAMPNLEGQSTITMINQKSWPYIEMTFQVLQNFEVHYKKRSENTWSIDKSEFKTPGNYNIEADWSSAAFWIVAAIINGKVTLNGLNPNSNQADKAILEVLDQIDAKYTWVGNDLFVEKSELQPFAFDATDCPDLFPILAVLAACSKGDSGIKGVERLRHKESDRASVLQSEFKKLGVEITIDNDVMIVHGKGVYSGGAISAHNDHRIAMAFAVASLNSNDPINIEEAESVAKSYANFWEHWALIAQGDQ